MTLDDSAAGQTGPRPRRPGPAVLLGAIPLLIGGYLGIVTADYSSRGDLAGLAAVLLFIAVAAVAGLIGVVGLVALVWPGGRGQRLGVGALATAGFLAAGYLGGALLADTLGPKGQPQGEPVPTPVVLRADAEVSVEFEGVAGFTPRAADDARGETNRRCVSGPDTEAVWEVDASDVGELNGRGMAVLLEFREGPSIEEYPRVFLGVDTGEAVVAWTGTVVLVDGGGSAGRVRFEGVPLRDRFITEWPAALSGEITWRCGPWLGPA